MPHLNVEIKARLTNNNKNMSAGQAKCPNPGSIRKYLLANVADFIGTDEQTDTYFHCSKGRLKLREGNIENNLIWYERDNQAGPKNSRFQLIKINGANGLKQMLEQAYGIKIIVKKKREIYYIGNVKFHIDEVAELGSFVEIEAGNMLTDKSEAELRQQCEFYLAEFQIKREDLISVSYSDMLWEKENKML